MQQIVMVTGKGGVGKSFVASLLARNLSLAGKKTLLVEMVPQSYLAQTLELTTKGTDFEPTRTQYGFDWSVWTGEACLSDYVKFWVKVSWVSQAFLNNSWLKSLVQMAPGLREISFLGKLTSQIRKHGPVMDYDHIVVDAVSTGHFLSLLRAPEGLSQVVTAGPMKEQTESILKVLNDAQLVHTLVVTNLESFSINEAQELNAQLHEVLKSEVSFVANKIYPIPSLVDTELVTSPEINNFIGVQKSLKTFQAENIDKLRSLTAKVFTIPFYFSKLSSVLEENDGVRILFK